MSELSKDFREFAGDVEKTAGQVREAVAKGRRIATKILANASDFGEWRSTVSQAADVALATAGVMAGVASPPTAVLAFASFMISQIIGALLGRGPDRDALESFLRTLQRKDQGVETRPYAPIDSWRKWRAMHASCAVHDKKDGSDRRAEVVWFTGPQADARAKAIKGFGIDIRQPGWLCDLLAPGERFDARLELAERIYNEVSRKRIRRVLNVIKGRGERELVPWLELKTNAAIIPETGVVSERIYVHGDMVDQLSGEPIPYEDLPAWAPYSSLTHKEARRLALGLVRAGVTNAQWERVAALDTGPLPAPKTQAQAVEFVAAHKAAALAGTRGQRELYALALAEIEQAAAKWDVVVDDEDVVEAFKQLASSGLPTFSSPSAQSRESGEEETDAMPDENDATKVVGGAIGALVVWRLLALALALSLASCEASQHQHDDVDGYDDDVEESEEMGRKKVLITGDTGPAGTDILLSPLVEEVEIDSSADDPVTLQLPTIQRVERGHELVIWKNTYNTPEVVNIEAFSGDAIDGLELPANKSALLAGTVPIIFRARDNDWEIVNGEVNSGDMLHENGLGVVGEMRATDVLPLVLDGTINPITDNTFEFSGTLPEWLDDDGAGAVVVGPYGPGAYELRADLSLQKDAAAAGEQLTLLIQHNDDDPRATGFGHQAITLEDQGIKYLSVRRQVVNVGADDTFKLALIGAGGYAVTTTAVQMRIERLD